MGAAASVPRAWDWQVRSEVVLRSHSAGGLFAPVPSYLPDHRVALK